MAPLGEPSDSSGGASHGAIGARLVELLLHPVEQLVDRTAVLGRSLQAGERCRRPEGTVVVPGRAHRAHVGADGTPVGIRALAQRGEERAELSEVVVACVGGAVHPSDRVVVLDVEFDVRALQEFANGVLAEFAGTTAHG